MQTSEIKQRLREIARDENVEADDAALTLLAQRAKGSMRDSQSLLEQLLAFTSGTLTTEDVHQLLGTADTRILFELAHALLNADSAEVLQQIRLVSDAGVDAGQLGEQLLGLFRDVMAAKAGCNPEVYLFASADDQTQLLELAAALEMPTLLQLLQILDRTLVSMRGTAHGRTLLEMAAVRICQLDHVSRISTLVHMLQSGKLDTEKLAVALESVGRAPHRSESPSSGGKKNGPPEPAGKPTDLHPSSNLQPGSLESRLDRDDPPHGLHAAEVRETPEPMHGESSGRLGKLNPGNAEQYWQQTLQEIGDSTSVMAGQYDELALVENNRLVVKFRDAYNVESCRRAEKKSRFEQVFRELTKSQIRIEFVHQPMNEAVPEKPASTAVPRRQVIRELHQHPMLSKAIEIFDAEIVDFKRIQK